MPRVTVINLAGVLTCFAGFIIGCAEDPPQTTPAPAAPRLAASKLTVMVVDDPGIADGLKLLRGEWSERSGGELEIRESTDQELLDAVDLSVDLVIYPTRHLGALVDREWLRPVRESVLESEDVALADWFPLVRNKVLPYGKQVYALTLGEPPLMLSSSQQFDESPKLWDGLNGHLSTSDSPLQYPLAVELLVRGAAYSQHRGQTPGWFSPESMKPLLDSQPYLTALTQMIGGETSQAERPKRVIALSWPSALLTESTPLRFMTNLPQAGRVYNPLLAEWEEREDSRPLVILGFAGRSISVARTTRNSSSAFKLLQWLVSESISSQLSPRSASTVWFRKSQSDQAKKWLEAISGADQVASRVSGLLSSDNGMVVPRIPGIDEYLKLLDSRISDSMVANTSAATVLANVVKDWESITDRLGRNRQQVAYRKHLGLDDSNE